MAKKAKFVFNKEEERITDRKGREIGTVWPLPVAPEGAGDAENRDWGYYVNITDYSAEGGSKEDAIKDLKRDHAEALAQLKEKLVSFFKEIKKWGIEAKSRTKRSKK